MTRRVYQLLGVCGIGLLASVALPSTGAAQTRVPSGLDVSTLLGLYDRARRLAYRLDQPGSDPEGGGQSLASVDTVVIDPGHGGENLGAVGITGVAEKYLTLELAMRVRGRLQRRYPDLSVLLTRYWDRSLSLHERTHLANRVGADLFLSVHYNAAGHARAGGVETYFLAVNETIPGRQERQGEPVATLGANATGLRRPAPSERYGVQGEELALIQRDLRRARRHESSGRLAELTQAELTERLSSTDRGVKQTNFGVLRGALMPAVVVEAGFLTHPLEGRRVGQPQRVRKVVSALVETVRRYDDYAASRGSRESAQSGAASR